MLINQTVLKKVWCFKDKCLSEKTFSYAETHFGRFQTGIYLYQSSKTLSLPTMQIIKHPTAVDFPHAADAYSRMAAQQRE